jgi:hypothetical protein
MSASALETYLARVAAVLLAAGISTHRGRADGFDEAELPAVSLLRGEAPAEPWANGREVIRASFELHCLTTGADWETTTDALHMQAHAALLADAQLAALGKGLRCTGTSAQPDAGGNTAGRIAATYQTQIAVRVADLTHTL